MIDKEYIGDGVYIKGGEWRGEVVLYLDNGITETNFIYLEVENIDRIKKFTDQWINQ